MQSEALDSIVAAVPLPLVVVDASERVIALNAAAEELFGRGLRGRHYISVLRQPAILDAVEGVLSTSQPKRSHYLGSEAGRETSFAVHCTPIRNGMSQAVMIALEDTTHMQEVGQMRRDFVANVSHELKTPLTALQGFIETLRGAAKNDPAARERFLQIMEREARRMNRLVNDLLSLSRVEAEERVRPSQQVDIAAIVGRSVATLRSLARDRAARIDLHNLERSAWVQGDPDQLIQVMTNLIENAIKYGGETPEVTVSVDLSPREPSLRGPAVRITVSDKGEGIDPIHLPRLTERFYRVDSHRSREMGGTGLGLAIVKHIVNRHRGRLRIQSELCEGSSFTVLLPVQEVNETADPG